MKNRIFVLGISILFLSVGLMYAGCGNEKRVIISENFSVCPPLGWEAKDYPGLKYKVILGPIEDEFAANIVFVDENFNGNLKNYVDGSLYNSERFFSEYRLVDRKPFRTESGIEGERVIINNSQGDKYLKQVFYFFICKNNNYITITCSVLDAVSEKYLPLFDESIKTFELIQ